MIGSEYHSNIIIGLSDSSKYKDVNKKYDEKLTSLEDKLKCWNDLPIPCQKVTVFQDAYAHSSDDHQESWNKG